MTARFEAEYGNGVSYYGGAWAPGATPGIGLDGKITAGLSTSKGRTITFILRGLALPRVMAYMATRWPHIARALVDEMNRVGFMHERGKLSMTEQIAMRNYEQTGIYGFELSTRFSEVAETAYRAKLDT